MKEHPVSAILVFLAFLTAIGGQCLDGKVDLGEPRSTEASLAMDSQSLSESNSSGAVPVIIAVILIGLIVLYRLGCRLYKL